MWVEDQRGRIIFLHEFNYTDATPEVSFAVPSGVTELTPFEHCNLHQTWQGKSTLVVYEGVPTSLSSSGGGGYIGGGGSSAPTLTEGADSVTAGFAQLKSDLSLTWTASSADLFNFELTLDATAWLALGVSKQGFMTYPVPSHAVTGSVADGVVQRRLEVQDPAGVIVLDTMAMSNTSFTQADGKSTLSFTAPLSWIEQHDTEADAFKFIYAHGTSGSQSFGYHGSTKGRFG